jgi:hypothetical protein
MRWKQVQSPVVAEVAVRGAAVSSSQAAREIFDCPPAGPVGRNPGPCWLAPRPRCAAFNANDDELSAALTALGAEGSSRRFLARA